ncbi:VCBS repeat-containing protein [Candidatus Binatia bacterium]|nr:VCBS repeat-containing protein [Candidatus Binatia bacterium]
MRRVIRSGMLSVCGICVAWCGALGQPPVGFGLAGEFDVGLTPLGIAAGDFDGDGVVDLCTANSDSGDVSVLFGVGDGTFDVTLPGQPAGLAPVSIATGDVDDDGDVDIVVADASGSTIGVLLNEGDATFAPVVETDTGDGPEAVVLGHFDDDEFLDAATANYDDETVTVLLGEGDGTFTLGDELLVGSSPVGLATDDLDGDGRADLVVANSTGGDESAGSVTVLVGLGEGKFEAMPEIEVDCDDVDCTPVALGIADLNGDGKLDIAVANESGSNVSILLGDGNFEFTAGAIVPASGNPEAIAIADYNADGKLDIATSSDSDDRIVVLLGKGDGTFLPEPQTTVMAEAAAGSATITLVDAGRFPDEGWVQLGESTRVGYVSKADNVLTLGAALVETVPADTPAIPVFPTDGAPWGLVSADFNGDGKPDVATANAEGDNVTVLLNTSGAVSPCVGDCKNDGEVTVDDLIIMVNVANGAAPVADCLAGDANHDGTITIDDIIIAVNNALNGCPEL